MGITSFTLIGLEVNAASRGVSKNVPRLMSRIKTHYLIDPRPWRMGDLWGCRWDDELLPDQ